MFAKWPQAEEVDEAVLKEGQYISDVLHDFRVRMKKMNKLREKVSFTFIRKGQTLVWFTQKGQSSSKPEYGVIYVATDYPTWQLRVLTKLREIYEVTKIALLSVRRIIFNHILSILLLNFQNHQCMSCMSRLIV